MKLTIEPKQHIIVGGKDYVADAKGVVDVPDKHAIAEGHASAPAKGKGKGGVDPTDPKTDEDPEKKD